MDPRARVSEEERYLLSIAFDDEIFANLPNWHYPDTASQGYNDVRSLKLMITQHELAALPRLVGCHDNRTGASRCCAVQLYNGTDVPSYGGE